MPDDLQIRVSSPGARETAEDLKRVAAGERRVGHEGDEAGRGLGKAAREGGRLRGALAGIAGALGMGLGIGAAVSKIVELLRQWEQHAERIAQLHRQSAQDLTAFAMMQAPGTAGQRARQVAVTGARYGVSPGAAWSAQQAMQSQAGGFEAGLEAFARSAELARAGVPFEAAQQAVSIGMGLGMTPSEAARAPYAAGEASSLSAAQMAQAASMGLPEYRGIGGGPLFGYQVMAGLSGVIKEPGQLGTYTAQAARALSTEEGKIGALWRRLGVRPSSGMAQLRALHAAGIRTTQDLARAGFGEVRQRMALSLLVGNLEGFERTAGQVAGRFGEADLVTREWERAAGEVPAIKYTQAMAAEEARREAEMMTGPAAEPALERALLARQRATQFELAGMGWAGGWGYTGIDQIPQAAGVMLSQTLLGQAMGIKSDLGTMYRLFNPPDSREAGGGTVVINQGVNFSGAYVDPAAKVPRPPR